MKTFVCYGVPIGKPRMSQRDKWAKRPCVVRYREWCDVLRYAASQSGKRVLLKPTSLLVTAYLPIPESWSVKKRATMQGTPHTAKPDSDNILKACADALIENDHYLYQATVQKFWDDGEGPRVEVTLD